MKSNNKFKVIAKERINSLFEQADKTFKKNPKLSDRYITLARKIAMKSRVRIPRELKRKFCKHCYHYLKSGVNLRIRTKDKKVVYYCLDCKKYMRFIIKTKH
ncbi:MAG: ribonuclease P protein component 4 [Candidatus Nanoarchaeia archaeon]|jgi:ribonuclease P protein subunit RPR2|nr:ribonuclease P protein component 4 [Candidatus Nanoarchaeia archaeon]|tara:strand:+ start:6480 stop:6785 length:306 start_codon:yes stop_codon:yes gene_type:complete